MADERRIEDLRRRVQQDPASIVFAQLAEELRREGSIQEAIDICRAGLAIHPSYLSARVTLARALLALDQLDAGAAELGKVLRAAPENLAAQRAMGDIFRRRGQLPDALTHYRAALAIAPTAFDLEFIVADLARQCEPAQSGERDRAAAATAEGSGGRVLAALETFLAAVHVARADRSA